MIICQLLLGSLTLSPCDGKGLGAALPSPALITDEPNPVKAAAAMTNETRTTDVPPNPTHASTSPGPNQGSLNPAPTHRHGRPTTPGICSRAAMEMRLGEALNSPPESSPSSPSNPTPQSPTNVRLTSRAGGPDPPTQTLKRNNAPPRQRDPSCHSLSTPIGVRGERATFLSPGRPWLLLMGRLSHSLARESGRRCRGNSGHLGHQPTVPARTTR